MNIKEVLDTEILEEGLVFFKESKKINRTIVEIEKKLYKIRNSPLHAPLKTLLTKLKKLQVKFEEVENSIKDKKLSRQKFKSLKVEYKDLLSLVNDYETKRILKKVGLFILFASATVILGEVISNISDNNKHLDANDVKHSETNTKSTSALYHPDKDNNLMHTISDVGATANKVDIKPQHIVAKICTEEGVPYEIVNGIIKKESNWKIGAIGTNSGAGGIPKSRDVGLMQLNSKYIDWFVQKFWKVGDGKFDPMDVHDNVTIGVRYYKYLLKMFKGNIAKALEAYNAGPNAVRNGTSPASAKKYALSILALLTNKKSIA